MIENHIDLKYLINFANKYSEKYRTAQPYPHIIIDDFFKNNIISWDFPYPK